MIRRLASLLLLGMAAATAKAEDTNTLPPCVVEVLVTAQHFDARIPWKKSRPEVRAGYGVVIGDGQLVTTEDLVRNAVLVEIRRPGASTKTPATITEADPRINAALLAAPTPGLIPAEWDGRVKNGTTIQLVQFDEAGQRQNGEGRITGIEVAALPAAAHSILAFQVLTDLKLDRVGAPAFHDNLLAGLVMHYDESSQTSQVLPSAILRRFADDATHPPYRGIAAAGLLWAPLIEPDKRQYLGLPDDHQGVLVLRTVPGSGASSVLQSGDVILGWDGQAVDAQGYYQDPEFGRLSLVHQITGRRRPGETVVVTRWRNRKQEEVRLTLDAHDDQRALVPMNAAGRPADYLVEGGFVIRELTADYLLAFGQQWLVRANARLVNLYLTRAQSPEKPGNRVVILSGVLPDPVNAGYQEFQDEVITAVNGQTVSNLDDVFAIREKDGGISRITLQSLGVDLVLDKAGLLEANRRIAQLYGIPRLERRNPPSASGSRSFPAE